MSEQDIDKWARKYAVYIRDFYPLLEEKFLGWYQDDMPMSQLAGRLVMQPEWLEVTSVVAPNGECAKELTQSEYNFMLAAIPHWLGVLEREQVDDPELTVEQKVYATIDKIPPARWAVRRFVQAAVPPMRWLTGKLRAYNEGRE